MNKKTLLKIVLPSLLFMFIAVGAVSAQENYNSFDVRQNQNKKMYNEADKLPLNGINSYKDKSLNDTNNALSSEEIAIINDIASSVSGDDLDSVKKLYNDVIINSNLSNNNLKELLKDYNVSGKYNGSNDAISNFLVGLLRSKGIPSRVVQGYYGLPLDENYKWEDSSNVYLVSFYMNNRWIVTSPYAEIVKYNELDDKDSATIDNYFDLNYSDLSKDHVLISYPKGLTLPYYVYNNDEVKYLTDFLNINYQNKTNGKRANSSYNRNNSYSWFENDSSAKTNGYGRLVFLNYSKNRGYYGNLNLKNFTELKKLSIPNNKLTKVDFSNFASLEELIINNNNIDKLVVSGSKLSKLNASSNPFTYASYSYGKNKRVANVRVNTGGTFYLNVQNNTHTLVANTKKDYKFLGWYNGNKRLTTNKTYKFNSNSNFTYTAKFEKVKKQVKKVVKKKKKSAYIKISIKKQKLYYYNKKGKVIYKTHVVTGQKGKYNTPRGNYKVQAKMRKVHLVGDDYVNYVRYWVLIDWKKQIGIHDASWRSYFGGKIYKYNGSHGCINVSNKAAKYIYKKVSVGTPVVIVK